MILPNIELKVIISAGLNMYVIVVYFNPKYIYFAFKLCYSELATQLLLIYKLLVLLIHYGVQRTYFRQFPIQNWITDAV